MRAPAGGARRVPLLIGLAAVGLTAVVALASGDPILGHRGDRPVEEGVASLTAVWWVLIILCASFALAIVLYLMVLMKGRGKPGQSKRKSLIGLLVLLAIVLLGVRFHPPRTQKSDTPPPETATTVPADEIVTTDGGGNSTAWWPILAVGALAVGGAVVGLRARKAPRPEDDEDDDEDDDASLPALVALGIEALRAEPDPRRAVIASYARLEAGLAASGRPRRAHETPSEYLARLLAASGLPPDALAALTHLYEWARFSDAPLPPDAREQALASLSALETRLDRTRLGVG